MFSSGFLTAIVYGSLAWCTLSFVGLAVLIARDLAKGESW